MSDVLRKRNRYDIERKAEKEADAPALESERTR